jgi:hypothetical protein
MSSTIIQRYGFKTLRRLGPFGSLDSVAGDADCFFTDATYKNDCTEKWGVMTMFFLGILALLAHDCLIPHPSPSSRFSFPGERHTFFLKEE